MSARDVTVARKKPFSRLSGVFDSIGAQERCLEFIEFVIFGLGVKRAPVCCRKTLHQRCPPHLPMTADAQGQPSSNEFFFFQFAHHALCTLFISNTAERIFVSFIIKVSSGAKKSPPVTTRKTLLFQGRFKLKSEEWWRLTTHTSAGSKQRPANIQRLQYDSHLLAVGKLGNSNRDCVLF